MFVLAERSGKVWPTLRAIRVFYCSHVSACCLQKKNERSAEKGIERRFSDNIVYSLMMHAVV